MTPMRLLIYGGTFNPPHLGHADALSCAAEYLHADAVLVIPAGIPPHKALAEGSPEASERLRLCELAFENAEVSPMELLREGKSYTVDTLERISAEKPEAELYFLVGTDMLLYMEQWHDFRSTCGRRTVQHSDKRREEADAQRCADRGGLALLRTVQHGIPLLRPALRLWKGP